MAARCLLTSSSRTCCGECAKTLSERADQVPPLAIVKKLQTTIPAGACSKAVDDQPAITAGHDLAAASAVCCRHLPPATTPSRRRQQNAEPGPDETMRPARVERRRGSIIN